jgi:hypothetical protein
MSKAVDFYGVNDTDQNNVDAIQPIGNESAGPNVIRRPSENLRARTEILRAEANRARFVTQRVQELRLFQDGDVRLRWYGPWDGTGIPTTEGTLVIQSGTLLMAPLLGAGEDRDPTDLLKYGTRGAPHADLLAYYDLRIGADPEYVRIVADGKEETGTDFLTLTIIRATTDLPGGVPNISVVGNAPPADDLGFRRGQVDIVVEISLGGSTTTTYQHLVDAINDPASATFGLVTAYVMNGAATACPTRTRAEFTPGLNAPLMSLSGGQLAAFFTATTANRLREGDVLGVAFARWQEMLAMTPDNADITVLAGDLRNLSRAPQDKHLCLPIGRVLGGNLHLMGGAVFGPYDGAFPAAFESLPFPHASNLITEPIATGDTALDTRTVAGQLFELATLADDTTVAQLQNTRGRSGLTRLYGATYHSGGAVTAGAGGSVNIAATTYRDVTGQLRTTPAFTNVALNATEAGNYIFINATSGAAGVVIASDATDAAQQIPLAYVLWDQVSVLEAIVSVANTMDRLDKRQSVTMGSGLSLYGALLNATDLLDNNPSEICVRGANSSSTDVDLPVIQIQERVRVYGESLSGAPAVLTFNGYVGPAWIEIAGGTLILEDLDLATLNGGFMTSLIRMSAGTLILRRVKMNMTADPTIVSQLLPEALIECSSWNVKIIIEECELNAAKRIIYMNVAADVDASHDIEIRDSELRLQGVYATQEYVIDCPAEETVSARLARISIRDSKITHARPLRGVRLWAGLIELRNVLTYTAFSLYGGEQVISGAAIDPRGVGTVVIDGFTFEPERSDWFPRPSAEAIKPLFLRRVFGARLSKLVFNHTNDDSLAATSDGSRNAYLVLSDCVATSIEGVAVATASLCACIAMRASNTLRNTCNINGVHLYHTVSASTPREGIAFNGRGTVTNVVSENFEDEKTVLLEAGSQRTIVSHLSVRQTTGTGDGTTNAGSDNIIDTGTISVFA